MSSSVVSTIFAKLANSTGTSNDEDVIAACTAIDASSPLLGSSDADKKKIQAQHKYLTTIFIPSSQAKDAKWAGQISKINRDLTSQVFLELNRLTVVDIWFYVLFHPFVSGWSMVERVQYCNVTRWFDFIQHQLEKVTPLPIVEIEKNVPTDIQLPVTEKKAPPPKPSADAKVADGKAEASKPKEATNAKESATPASNEAKSDDKKAARKEMNKAKAEAKQKEKPAAPVAKELPVDVSRLDIRIGKILECKKHESADSLYVSQIDVGEEKPRQVVSGLVKFVPQDEMQGRIVVVLCNLKPANLRNTRSEAMVLAASNDSHDVVELLEPPQGVTPGERVTFPGFPGEPDAQLNPKHKVFEAVQPDFKTKDDCTAVWRDAPFTTSKGTIRVKTLKQANIK